MLYKVLAFETTEVMHQDTFVSQQVEQSQRAMLGII